MARGTADWSVTVSAANDKRRKIWQGTKNLTFAYACLESIAKLIFCGEFSYSLLVTFKTTMSIMVELPAWQSQSHGAMSRVK